MADENKIRRIHPDGYQGSGKTSWLEDQLRVAEENRRDIKRLEQLIAQLEDDFLNKEE